MIHWNIVVYIIVLLPFLGYTLYNFFEEGSGGMWVSGKDRYDLGITGILSLIACIGWTLIWGGFFWW